MLRSLTNTDKDRFHGLHERKIVSYVFLEEIKDEVHFRFYCSVCDDLRAALLDFVIIYFE